MGDSKKPPEGGYIPRVRRRYPDPESVGPGNGINEQLDLICKVECIKEKVFIEGQELWFKISGKQLLAILKNEIIGFVLEPEKNTLEQCILNNKRCIGSIIGIEKSIKTFLTVAVKIMEY